MTAEEGNHKCPQCDRRFKASTSLGGHVSKKHPGSSAKYLKKTARRDERANEREVLARAKILFKETTGLDPKAHRAKVT